MKLKVCGMRNRGNMTELLKLSPDYMGMIFYEKSKRYVTDVNLPDLGKTQLIGVFVNSTTDEIKELAKRYPFDYLQLHGSESVKQVSELKQLGYQLIKVFGVESELPLASMKDFEPYVNYFLFDTQTPDHGGSGRKFDWSILENYHLKTPYFLSGGIDISDIKRLKSMQLEKLYAIDVNSKFEKAPGDKDIEKLRLLKQAI